MANTLLIGQAEEIDPVLPEVRRMVENEGVYVCGDTTAPAVTVPVISIGGVLYSIQLDKPLDPQRFRDTVTIEGPFRKRGDVASTHGGADNAAACNTERKPVDVLDIINRVAIFNGGPVAYDLCQVGQRVEELIEAAREAERDVALLGMTTKRLSAALAAVGGGA